MGTIRTTGQPSEGSLKSLTEELSSVVRLRGQVFALAGKQNVPANRRLSNTRRAGACLLYRTAVRIYSVRWSLRWLHEEFATPALVDTRSHTKRGYKELFLAEASIVEC